MIAKARPFTAEQAAQKLLVQSVDWLGKIIQPILDGIGYVKNSDSEIKVVFRLIVYCYEHIQSIFLSSVKHNGRLDNGD